MDYQPYNYSIQQPDPSQAIMGGIKNAIGINEAFVQRDVRQREMEVQKQAQARAQQQQSDLAEVMKNPTLKAVQNITLKYPELGKMMENQINSLTSSEKDATIQRDLPLFMALKNGKPEVARSMIERHLESAKNSGDEAAIFEAENALDVLNINPNAMIFSLNGKLSAAMGGKNFADATSTFDKNEREQQLQPLQAAKLEAETRKTGSEADKAAVVAKFAESDAVMELEKKGWDIKAIQNDMQVKRQNVAIASMNARTSASNAAQSNSLKAQENQIKLAELMQKRDDTVREKVYAVEEARSAFDSVLTTTDRILATPIGVIESATGPISSRIPTLSSDTADFEALVEGFDAQAFVSQVQKMKGSGLGGLSNAEGGQLTKALQNLSLKQSAKQLVQNVKEVQRIVLKSRTALAGKYGVPDTVPDTPNAAPSGGSIDALLKKYGQ